MVRRASIFPEHILRRLRAFYANGNKPAAPPHPPLEAAFLSYEGFSIPSYLISLTGAGPERFIAHAEGQLAEVQGRLGLDHDHVVVEIGCGVGRSAIPLTRVLTAGKYLGVDIIEPSIQWAQKNISARYPNFSFVHFDIADGFHNPNGAISTTDVRLPVDDETVDRIILWSVFTHLFQEEIVHYLKEFRRILKPNGKVWASCFVLTPQVLDMVRAEARTEFFLSFLNPPDDFGCYVHNVHIPRGAVGYTPDALTSMVEEAGLRLLTPFVKGAWSGFYESPESGQDGMILGRA